MDAAEKGREDNASSLFFAPEGVIEVAPSEQSHAALLGQTRLFAGLDAGAIEHLERRSRVRNYRRGETVFITDEPGDCLYVVVSGLVKVFVSSPRGDDLVLATVGPGDAFGELSILDGGGRSASAEAVDAATLLILDRSSFTELIRERPELVLTADLGRVGESHTCFGQQRAGGVVAGVGHGCGGFGQRLDR